MKNQKNNNSKTTGNNKQTYTINISNTSTNTRPGRKAI